MLNRIPSLVIAFLAALVAAGCAAPAPDYSEPEIRQGTIEQITPVNIANNHGQGLGAILGGAAGVGLGSLIGAGTGRDVAIAAGAIAGAIGGNVAQNRYFDKPQPAQQLFVRLQSGVLIAITQPVNPAIQRGMRVYVEGTGHEARVVPA